MLQSSAQLSSPLRHHRGPPSQRRQGSRRGTLLLGSREALSGCSGQGHADAHCVVVQLTGPGSTCYLEADVGWGWYILFYFARMNRHCCLLAWTSGLPKLSQKNEERKEILNESVKHEIL